MKWILAASTLVILSQPAFSQQQRPCQQGDVGQTGITGCRTPDITGATIDRSGTFNAGPTTPSATNQGSGGPVVVPNDPLATGLLPNPLVGAPGVTGLGTAGPQAQIPSRAPAPTTTTPPAGSGGTAVGATPQTPRSVGAAPRTSTGSGSNAAGTAGTTGMATTPKTSKHSGRKVVGAGNSTTTGTSSVPSTSMGSGGSAIGGGNHTIRPMGGNHAIRSRSHSHR